MENHGASSSELREQRRRVVRESVRAVAETNCVKEELRRRMEEVEERRKAVEEEEARVWKRSLEADEREKALSRRVEEVQLEDDRIVKRSLELERRHRESVARFEVVESREKELETRILGVESSEKEIEKRFWGLESKERVNKERSDALQSAEDQIVKRNLELKRREKENEERLGLVELREMEIEGRLLAVENKERGVEERLVEMEKEIEGRFEVIKMKEKNVEEGLSGLGVKSREVEDSFRELESTKQHVEKCCEDVELKAKRVEERCGIVKLEEEIVRKRSVEVIRKEKELYELSQQLDSKKQELDSYMKELELKAKKINERREALELWEREVNEGRPAPDMEETQFRQWCSEMESKQKIVEGLLKALGLKETEISERTQALDLKEKLVDEHCMAEELRENETDERCREIELEKGRIREQVLGLERRDSEISKREAELKESVMDERLRAMELKEKENNDLSKGIEAKRRELVFEENRLSRVSMELDRRKREQGLKEKKLSEDINSLKVKEKKVNNQLLELNSIESKLKEVNTGLHKLEVTKKLVNEYSDHVDLKMKQVNARFEELEAKEKLVKESFDKVNLSEKAIKDKESWIEFKKNVICENVKAVELKEKQNHELSEELKLKQKEIEEKCLALELKEKEFIKRCQEHDSIVNVVTDVPLTDAEWTDDLRADDGEALQRLLNDRVAEHCFMGEAILKALKSYNDPPGLVLSALNGFFPPHLRKHDVAYAANTVRSSCVLLLEQLMNMRPELCSSVRVKAEEMTRFWRRKMEENGESRVVVLGFLLLVAAYRLTLQFEMDELKRLWKIIDQHRLAPRLRFELDLFDECEEYDVFPQPETGRHPSGSVNNDDEYHCSEIQSVCSKMDANNLRSYLNKHVMNHKLFPQKVAAALKSAPDAAMLVYKVLQTFNLPNSDASNKTSCIFLLEQLLKLQKHQPFRNPLGNTQQVLKPPLEISNDVKINVLAFASRWKRRLTKEGLKPLEVYGFLQFLVSYKLASLYDRDELLQLFKVFYSAGSVYWPEENRNLCRALGLTKNIHGLIRSLIKGDQRLQAAKYICVLMEERQFPLAPLLKDHVRYVQQRVENIPGITKDKCTDKIKVTFELTNLREVLQYIKEYKLEQEYSPTDLEIRIKQLETILEYLKTVPTQTSERPPNFPIITKKNNEAKVDSPGKIDDSVKNHSCPKPVSTQASARPLKHPVITKKTDVAKQVSSKTVVESMRKCSSDCSNSDLESHKGSKRLASSPISESPEQEKRFRAGLKSPVRPNISFKIPSKKKPFSSEIPQSGYPHQQLKSCSVNPRGKNSGAVEHPAQRSETSPTRKSMPGAIYSAAVAPYGEDRTQDKKYQSAQHS